jgi:hypothetical protein
MQWLQLQSAVATTNFSRLTTKHHDAKGIIYGVRRGRQLYTTCPAGDVLQHTSCWFGSCHMSNKTVKIVTEEVTLPGLGFEQCGYVRRVLSNCLALGTNTSTQVPKQCYS